SRMWIVHRRLDVDRSYQCDVVANTAEHGHRRGVEHCKVHFDAAEDRIVLTGGWVEPPGRDRKAGRPLAGVLIEDRADGDEGRPLLDLELRGAIKNVLWGERVARISGRRNRHGGAGVGCDDDSFGAPAFRV